MAMETTQAERDAVRKEALENNTGSRAYNLRPSLLSRLLNDADQLDAERKKRWAAEREANFFKNAAISEQDRNERSGKIGDGGPAFPVPNNVAWDESGTTAIDGMTLRDYFAAKAMQGLLVKPNECTGVVGVNGFEYKLAKSAYKIADAMLETDARGH